MNRWALIAVALCILAAGCGSDATSPSNQPLVFSAILSPANEVPPVAGAESGGRGAVQVQFAAFLRSPLPLYSAYCGYGQSGRVRPSAPLPII